MGYHFLQCFDKAHVLAPADAAPVDLSIADEIIAPLQRMGA